MAFTETERLIGDAAKSQAAMNSSNTVFDAKRLIGRKFSDAGVQSDMKHWPFTVVSGTGGTPIIEVEYKGEKKQFKAEEISSMVSQTFAVLLISLSWCTFSHPFCFSSASLRSWSR